MNKAIDALIPKAYELVRERHDGYFKQEWLLECMAELVVTECLHACISASSSRLDIGKLRDEGIDMAMEEIRKLRIPD